jgi:hypothetical protein
MVAGELPDNLLPRESGIIRQRLTRLGKPVEPRLQLVDWGRIRRGRTWSKYLTLMNSATYVAQYPAAVNVLWK